MKSRRFSKSIFIASCFLAVATCFSIYYIDRNILHPGSTSSEIQKWTEDPGDTLDELWGFFVSKFAKALTKCFGWLQDWHWRFKVGESKILTLVKSFIFGIPHFLVIVVIGVFIAICGSIWFGLCIIITIIYSLSLAAFYVCGYVISWIGAAISYVLARLYNGVLWVIDDIFDTKLLARYEAADLEMVKMVGAIAIFVISFIFCEGFILYPITWILYKFLVKPPFYLAFILIHDLTLLIRNKPRLKIKFIRFPRRESDEMADKSNKSDSFEKPEMPEFFEPEEIVRHLQKMPKDKALLKAYFSSISQRFHSKIEMRNLEVEMKKMNLGKEYFDLYYETRKAYDRVSDYDTEKELNDLDVELQRKRKKSEMEELERESQYKDRELKYKMTELDKKEKDLLKERKEEAKDDIQELIKKVMEKAISIIKAKEEIRKMFADNPELAEEMEDRFEQELAERGVSGGE